MRLPPHTHICTRTRPNSFNSDSQASSLDSSASCPHPDNFGSPPARVHQLEGTWNQVPNLGAKGLESAKPLNLKPVDPLSWSVVKGSEHTDMTPQSPQGCLETMFTEHLPLSQALLSTKSRSILIWMTKWSLFPPLYRLRNWGSDRPRNHTEG